uniref:Uncharacterized protein n=1 Tax=Meloidogyne enterolobii TaxID=390850 RepID=A0A6V7XY56_MELEN|nr:unnamed protein product [Meloidogyne enterolobii]
MLNHSPDASCVPFFDNKMGFFKVIAEHHSIVAGQQLFFCYGAHNNDQLWIEYGFRLLENPFNRVNISIDYCLRTKLEAFESARTVVPRFP